MSKIKLTKNNNMAFRAFLSRVLEPNNMLVDWYSPDVQRPITLKNGARKTLDAFKKDLRKLHSKFISMGGHDSVSPADLNMCFSTEETLNKVTMSYMKNFTRVAEEEEDTGEKVEIPDHLDHLELCVSSASNSREPDYFLFDTNKNIISSRSPLEYMRDCKIHNGLKHAKFVLPVYDPTREFGYFQFKTPDGEEVDAVNSYRPPLWMSHEGNLPDELPKEINVLFNQIEGEMDRKFFLHFLRQMIIGRNTSYLVLQGDGGIGKSVMKEVFSALVGHHNYASGKLSTLTGSFNSQLADTKLIVFDEIRYSQSEEAVMKEIPNNTVSIEGKFKNATKRTKLFCSMILMNNHKRDNYIAMDGRKFAPLCLSTTPLVKLLKASQISSIVKKCADVSEKTYDEAYVAQIGRWIIKHGDFSNLFPQGEYKGPKYWELAHSSLSQWQRATINALLDPGDANMASHRAKFAERLAPFKAFKTDLTKKGARKDSGTKFPTDISAYREFLHIYKNLKGEPVFKVGDFNEDEQDFKLYILPKKEDEEIEL